MRLTDKQKANVLSNITVIVDTREQKNEHILNYFRENNIPYKFEKLESADYSFILPKYPELGLDYKALIERKNSIDEIAGNFTKGRQRFINEFERLKDGQHIHLLIENLTWKKVFNGTYRSQITPKSLTASLITWAVRYNCPIWNCTTAESPKLIHYILHYELLEMLKNLQ